MATKLDWIKVEDVLPNSDYSVLVVVQRNLHKEYWSIGRYSKGEWFVWDAGSWWRCNDISHWQNVVLPNE